MLLHLAIEGAVNILTPPWYLLKPSCFSRESPRSILQSCCTFHYYMQPSCVQVSSAFVEPCLFHVPVTNTVTVLVVPQMLWATASWVLTDMTAVLAALCTGLSSIGWASECVVLRRSFRACNVTQLLWSRLLHSGLPAATSGCVKSHFWAALASQ